MAVSGFPYFILLIGLIVFVCCAGNAGADEISPIRAFADWACARDALTEEVDAGALATGMELAKARQAALKVLIEKTPKEAEAAMLSPEKIRKLPLAIRNLVEAPIAGEGIFRVIAVDDFKLGGGSYEYLLEYEGRHYRVFFSDRPGRLVTNQKVKFEGYVLDNFLLLSNIGQTR